MVDPDQAPVLFPSAVFHNIQVDKESMSSNGMWNQSSLPADM